MEERPDGLTNSVDLRPESCSIRREGFEPRLSFKLDVGELALQLLHSVSNILLNFGVVRFGQLSAFPGQVLFDFGLSISAVHRRHQPRIFGPACLDPETGIFLSSQQRRSSCLQVSSKVSYRRGRSRTGYSRSCLRGATNRHGSLRCRKYQPGASSGP